MAAAGTARPLPAFAAAFAVAFGAGAVLIAGLIAYAVIAKPGGGAPAPSAPLSVTLALPEMPETAAPSPDAGAGADADAEAFHMGAADPEDTPAEETGHAAPVQAPQAVAIAVEGVSEPYGDKGLALPRIRAADGMTPFTAYRRAYDAGVLQKPVLSFVALDAGLSDGVFTKLLEKLPADVALAFTPYRDTRAQSKLAREKGFETWLSLPLETRDFPRTDPGPNALFVDVSDEENMHNLRAVMAQSDGYVGMMPAHDSPFLASPGDMTAVADELAARGLAFADSGFAMAGDVTPYIRGKKIPFAQGRSFRIGVAADNAAITATLERALASAREGGYAVVYFTPYPALLDMLANFFTALPGKDVALAPLSLIADKTGS